MNRVSRLLLVACLLFPSLAALAETFVASDVRVRGLQRIPVERIYAKLPVKAGDTVDDAMAARVVRTLFRTGDFQDVRVEREADVLVVRVAERPAISAIDIEGNKSIGKEELLKGLAQAGIAAGEVFRLSTLENMRAELQRQYIAQGRYGAKVDAKVTPQSRNRVSVELDIREGKPANIGGIRIIGNRAFTDEQLLKVMKSREYSIWSVFNSDDKYAREKLGADLESLRSWYMDRGYINFQVRSALVSVTPDRRSVHVGLELEEGEKYTIGEVDIAGSMVIDEMQLRPLILVRPQQTFSQQLVTMTSDIMTKRLGIEGYIFASVRGIPEIDEENRTVKMVFFIEPGERTYVNRIDFTGNHKTRDDVLRREMRQFEGAPASQAAIDQSKRRLEQLGFFSTVKADTTKVPGVDDQVDVLFTVEEQPSGSIGANVGYSQGYGLVFGANVSQNNFFGTGNRVSFAVNRSQYRDSINLSYNNPYYTPDGVSRGWNLYFTETDYSETNLSSYAIDRAGGSVTFGYPTSEAARLSFGLGIDKSSVTYSDFVAEDVWQFIQDRGDAYDTLLSTFSWSRSTLNRGVLADRGAFNRIGIELALPGSDNTYFKMNYSGQRYFPLTRRLTLKGRADLGYGAGYGDSGELPFYQRYTAGGFGSVRGWEDRSLGLRSPAHTFIEEGTEDPDPSPVGGDLLVEAGLELIFPPPFAEDSRTLRTVFFVDSGNVFMEREGLFPFGFDEMRTSAGIALSWYTAIGPLSFSLARTLNKKPGDETQNFQFSLGQPF